MAGVTPRLSPARLADALGSLEVRIDGAHLEHRDILLPDYPGEPRPTSVVHITGDGRAGQGENVAFTRADHERFESVVLAWSRAHSARAPQCVSALLASSGTPYERAALEAALVDLALRQAHRTLYDLSGVRAVELRFVASLAVSPAPGRAIESLRAAGFNGDFKIDVDPAWSHEEVAQLAANPRIAIFDFKGRSDAALARELATLNPHALFEDPPSLFEDPSRAGHATRIARDASLMDANAVATACARGEAVNLKAPRMGGPLEVLRGLEHALAARTRAYLGGMFEVGVGRWQARQLAALYCADAPNDLALNTPRAERSTAREDSPTQVRLDKLGFGF
jgi:L-alanine-DL-glutamate epimerase-like enolase superfamily enzyme